MAAAVRHYQTRSQTLKDAVREQQEQEFLLLERIRRQQDDGDDSNRNFNNNQYDDDGEQERQDSIAIDPSPMVIDLTASPSPADQQRISYEQQQPTAAGAFNQMSTHGSTSSFLPPLRDGQSQFVNGRGLGELGIL